MATVRPDFTSLFCCKVTRKQSGPVQQCLLNMLAMHRFSKANRLRGDRQHIGLTFLLASQTLLIGLLLCCLSFPSLSIYSVHSEGVFMGLCVQAAVSAVSVTEEELSDKCAAETQVLLNSVLVSGVNGTPRSTFEQTPLFSVIQV